YHGAVSAKGIKQKRLVIDLRDPLLSVTDPTHSAVYFPRPTVPSVAYGSSPPAPPSFYRPQHGAIAPYSHGLTRVASPLKPSTAALFNGNLFQYSNYGSPFPFLTANHLSLGDEETYIADGRILKQYAVMEFHAEEQERNHTYFSSKFPTTATTYDPLYGSFAPQQPQFAPPVLDTFNPRFGVQHQPDYQQRSPLLTKNHGPIALGSGSLGYIHGPNGVTVGSGSLGYISHQQHRETLAELIERKKSKHLPSPLTFGHNHN
ncbi:AGAP008289-PA, partial [Anopheles gambiae str. PEST]